MSRFVRRRLLFVIPALLLALGVFHDARPAAAQRPPKGPHPVSNAQGGDFNGGPHLLPPPGGRHTDGGV